MAASMKKKVHVEYNSSDSGSEGDLESEEDVQSDTGDDNEIAGNPGLANAMAKILQKKVAANKVILAKGKTERELQKRKLEKDEDGVTKGDKKSAKLEEKDEDKLPQHEKKKLWENMFRSKPDPLKREKERQLQKIATRGVVQLFNAVRKQQKLVDEEISKVGSTETKKDKVMSEMTRDKFLNILKGSSSTNVVNGPKQPVKSKATVETSAEDKNEKWSILREDYMMGAQMKDWDKESSDDDDNEEGTGPGDPDLSDSD